MKIIRDITENEFVSEFLKGEIDSLRFGATIREISKRDHKNTSVVTNPDLKSEIENKYRAELLAEFRGFGRNTYLFPGFPSDTKWKRAYMDHGDFAKIKYCKFWAWVEMSEGSRRPADGVKNIMKGKCVEGIDNDSVLKLAKMIMDGTLPPPMILVSTQDNEGFVVLEGHTRITAFMLAAEHIPKEVEVIIGLSERMDRWRFY